MILSNRLLCWFISLRFFSWNSLSFLASFYFLFLLCFIISHLHFIFEFCHFYYYRNYQASCYKISLSKASNMLFKRLPFFTIQSASTSFFSNMTRCSSSKILRTLAWYMNQLNLSLNHNHHIVLQASISFWIWILRNTIVFQ